MVVRLVSIALNVPQEIVEALESRTFSLHIKGSAGTGKTTLALELMRLFPEKCEAVYLSTRVSPEKLYDQFPWSKSCILQENILDAKSSWYPKTNQETLFEYVDKPSFLRSLYSRALEAKGKHLIIIVDSLEALKSNLRIPEEDLSVERDVLEMADRLDASVIFVSETSEENKLDYLVDGVMRLEKELVNERLLRKLYIEKVRGTKIEKPMYLFTLKDGRFRCFEKGIQINLVHKELPKLEKMKKRKIPTLNEEMDRILSGGFQKGTFNIFDVGDKVGVGHSYVMTPLFFNFVLQGYPVFSVPSKGLYSHDIVGEFPPSILQNEVLELIKKNFYVFSPPIATTNALSKVYKTYFLEGVDYREDLSMFRDVAVKVLDEVQADTILVTMASDTMEYVYGTKDLLKIIQSWMDQIKQLNGILAIFQFRHGSLRVPTHLAATYFRLENIGGNIVFYGEIPRTKIYVTGLDISNKYVQTKFIPIE